MTGGTLNVEVGQGDTDPIDSNGDIIVSGGTINLTGQSGFDFDGSATYTGGDITINGEKQQRLKTQCLAAVVPKVVGNQVALEEVTKESQDENRKEVPMYIIIPAYEPDIRLIQVVQDITINSQQPVLLSLMMEVAQTMATIMTKQPSSGQPS